MRADRLKRCLVCMGGLLLGLSRPVEAHSGAVAIAVPLGKIRVEGAASKGGDLRTQPSSSRGTWVQVQPDSNDAYEVELPAGAYQVEGEHRRAETTVAAVAVNGGGIGWVVELVFPRQAFGAIIEASRGTRVKVGSGGRHGSWQTLGVADGLP